MNLTHRVWQVVFIILITTPVLPSAHANLGETRQEVARRYGRRGEKIGGGTVGGMETVAYLVGPDVITVALKNDTSVVEYHMIMGDPGFASLRAENAETSSWESLGGGEKNTYLWRREDGKVIAWGCSHATLPSHQFLVGYVSTLNEPNVFDTYKKLFVNDPVNAPLLMQKVGAALKAAKSFGGAGDGFGSSGRAKAEELQRDRASSPEPSQDVSQKRDFKKVAQPNKTRETFEGVALSQITRKAEQGDAQAQCKLGGMYFSGTLVEKDYIKALKWYKAAAESGDSEAQYNLGTLYEYGLAGLTIDPTEAKKWYQKAAEQGHQEAMKKLQ